MFNVHEVKTKAELMRFVKFPDTLYKDCPQYVPALHIDQVHSLTKCASLLYCKRKMWLALDGRKVVGRICAIINPRYNERYGTKRVRFGWFDCINDIEVARLLIGTAEKWAREQGMTEIHGPLYYNTLGKQGMLVEGYDNTFSNMRIGGVTIGVKIQSSGNSLRNIHPLYYNTPDGYENSYGFWDDHSDNWYSFCYSDQFATGFYNKGGRVFYTDCFVYWYSKRGEKHTAIKVDGKFNGRVTNLNVGFGKHNQTKENVVLEVKEEGGQGTMLNTVIGDPSLVTDNTHERYTK